MPADSQTTVTLPSRHEKRSWEEGRRIGRAEGAAERDALRDRIEALESAIEKAAGHLMGAHRPEVLDVFKPSGPLTIELRSGDDAELGLCPNA